MWSRDIRALRGAACLFLLASPGLAGAAPPAERPNFVVILADDLGYGDPSAYGGWIPTPQLDRMAREGLRFTDFHSNAALCSPTRAALLTGRYPQRAGIPGVVPRRKREENQQGLQAVESTFAERLKSAGYRTAIFGKWHLGHSPSYNPVEHGFDEFRGPLSGNVDYFSHVDQAGALDWWVDTERRQEEGYTTHLITRHALRFLEENRDRPFCLYLPHQAPHPPYQGPNDRAFREVGRSDLGAEAAQGEADARRAYREMVQEMDAGVGAVLDKIDELGLGPRTLVFFLSDNGASGAGSNGGLRGSKGQVWEGGHRVPAIAWWPGAVKAGVTDQLAIGMDLMPTLLDLAGVEPAAERPLDGISLAPLLREGRSLGPRRLYWHGSAMREGPWKLVLPGRDARGAHSARPMLFHLERNPEEGRDLAGEHPDRVQAMIASLESWRRDVEAAATPQPARKGRRAPREARRR